MRITTKYFITALAMTLILTACGDKVADAPDDSASNLGGTGGGALGDTLGDLGGGGLDMGVTTDSMQSTVDALNSAGDQAAASGNTALGNAYDSGAGYVGDLVGAYQALQQAAPNLTSGSAASLDNQFIQLAQEAQQLSTLFDSLGQQAMADLFRKMSLRKNIWAVVKPAANGAARKDAVASNLTEVMQFMQYGYKIAGGAFVTYNVQTAAALPFMMLKLTRCYDTAKTMFFVTKENSCPSGSTGAKVLGYIAKDQNGGALSLKEYRIDKQGNLANSANSITTASAKQQKNLKAKGYKETSLGFVF